MNFFKRLLMLLVWIPFVLFIMVYASYTYWRDKRIIKKWRDTHRNV